MTDAFLCCSHITFLNTLKVSYSKPTRCIYHLLVRYSINVNSNILNVIMLKIYLSN
jgi:hypothetical protein